MLCVCEVLFVRFFLELGFVMGGLDGLVGSGEDIPSGRSLL